MSLGARWAGGVCFECRAAEHIGQLLPVIAVAEIVNLHVVEMLDRTSPQALLIQRH